MNSKRRCSFCKEYFVPDDMIRAGIAGVCSSECLSGLQDKARAKRVRRREHRDAAKKARGIPGSLRLKVKRRDGKACRFCGVMNGRLEAHHIKYRSEDGPDEEENLITLCDEHHQMMHSNKRKWQPILLWTMEMQYEKGTFLTVPEAERRMKNPS